MERKREVKNSAVAKPFTVGLVQSAAGGSYQSNLETALRGIADAHAKGAQIVCLQELFTAPYFCKAEDVERFELAEDIPGPTVTRLQEEAKKRQLVIVVPLFERRAPGVYHNSAAVVDADGSLLGVYRKMHIPDDPLYYEKFYFTPGDADGDTRGFRVFDTRYARIGVLICWDQWYPEAARITSLMGAQVLFYPTAIGWHPAEKQEVGEDQWSAWQTMQRAHAVANGVFVAAANRVGHEAEPGTDGIEFFGRSFVSDPFGRLIAEAPTGEPAVIVAECDPQAIEDTRRFWPFLRDRRIDAYSPITRRFID